MRAKAPTNSSDPISALVEFTHVNGSVTNRECRSLLGVSYDHAIRLLNELCAAGVLTRRGAASGTHYVLANSRLSPDALAALKAKIF